MLIRPCIAIVLSILTLPAPSPAATHLVTPDGVGDYPTIQAAIDAAADGDSIVLAPGRFTGAGNRNIDTRGKAIVITSRHGPGETVIDAEHQARVFHIHQGETNATIISNLAVANGHVTDGSGAGMLCEGASPLLTELAFETNDFLALEIVNGHVDVIRCRFIGDKPPTWEWPYRSAITIVGSDVRLIDCRISLFHHWAIMGLNADVVMIGNTIEGNGSFDVDGIVSFDNCTVSMLGNVIRGNGAYTNSGVALRECMGEVRGNWIEGNRANLSGGGVEWEESIGDVSFNLLRENADGGIQFRRSSGSISRNLVVRTQGGCCSSGTAIWAAGCGPIAIAGNTLHRNGGEYDNYHPGFSAAEIVYDVSFPAQVHRNIIVGKSTHSWVVCDDYSPDCTTAMGTDTVHVNDVRNLLFGEPHGLYETVIGGCIDNLDDADPLFRSEANDNFFLRPGSEAVIDTVVGNFHVIRSWGALPKASGPSDALDVQFPPDDVPIGSSPGDLYPLTGFSINNTSTMDAVVNYRLVAFGGTLNDNGDPLALVGTTPILAPGETFVPPPAAVIVPEGNATVEVAYCFAYAPALNLVDTVTTTLNFEQPLSVRVTSFDATFEEEGVRLRWAATDDGLEGWHLYRSTNGDSWRRINTSALPSPARDYLDADASAGERYRYRLVAVQGDEAVVGQVEIAPRLALTLENAPNPFNPSTTIRFAIPSATDVRLDIFGVDGSRVRMVLAQELRGGFYNRTWDGRDDGGNVVPSGVYFCRLMAGKQQLTRKMVLAR